MKIVDEQLLKRYRTTRCELCNRKLPTDPHHAVFTRGHCRLDIDSNLVSLCRECHNGIDNANGRQKCLKIIAERQGLTTGGVMAVCRFFRNLLRGLTIQQMHEQCNRFSFPSFAAKTTAWATIASMPDQSPTPRPIKKKKTRPPSAARQRAKEWRKEQRARQKKWLKDLHKRSRSNG